MDTIGNVFGGLLTELIFIQKVAPFFAFPTVTFVIDFTVAYFDCGLNALVILKVEFFFTGQTGLSIDGAYAVVYYGLYTGEPITRVKVLFVTYLANMLSLLIRGTF